MTQFDEALNTKLGVVEDILRGFGSVLVAYSGGVDSTLLAWIAHGVLADRMLACTAVSAAIDESSVGDATRIAADLGIRYRIVATSELQSEAYLANAPDRCFVCKGVVFGRLRKIAQEEDLAVLVYGGNVDDDGDYRPGQRAAALIGARAPLAEAGMTKAEIRRVAHGVGLPNWDRPADACLSSRIPYGERITEDRLRRVARAERELRSAGFDHVRVRDHGTVARVEVEPERIAELADPTVRTTIVGALLTVGFSYVALDLAGYRTGSLNEVLGEAHAASDEPLAPRSSADGSSAHRHG